MRRPPKSSSQSDSIQPQQFSMKASPALEARIHQIKQECGGTKADVVRDGINLLYHLLYQLPEGSEICYKTPDGKVTELVIMYTGGKIEPKGRKPHQ